MMDGMPQVGDRVRLTWAVERFPHFMAAEGDEGTVAAADKDAIAVKMDRHMDGAEEWGNHIWWYDHDGGGPLTEFRDDTEPIGVAATPDSPDLEQRVRDKRNEVLRGVFGAKLAARRIVAAAVAEGVDVDEIFSRSIDQYPGTEGPPPPEPPDDGGGDDGDDGDETPWEQGRRREEALLEGIRRLAERHDVGPLAPMRIDTRGDITMLQRMVNPVTYEREGGLPQELRDLARGYDPNYRGEISGRWIRLNHFTWEKLLSDLGLLRSASAGRPLTKGDVVRMRPEWLGEGEGEFWLVVEDEMDGRVGVSMLPPPRNWSPMLAPPWQRIDSAYIEGVVGAEEVPAEIADSLPRNRGAGLSYHRIWRLIAGSPAG